MGIEPTLPGFGQATPDLKSGRDTRTLNAPNLKRKVFSVDEQMVLMPIVAKFKYLSNPITSRLNADPHVEATRELQVEFICQIQNKIRRA